MRGRVANWPTAVALFGVSEGNGQGYPAAISKHRANAMQSTPNYTRRLPSGFVEWDDTPSFAESLPHLLSWKGRMPAPAAGYAATLPAELMPQPVPASDFREPVQGMSVREVLDADVFRHFFGGETR